MTTTLLVLAACGGGGGNGAYFPPVGGGNQAPTVNQGKSGPKALVVEVDGLTHAALRDAIAQKKAAALEAFQVAPAWTGGANGTISQQRTTDSQGWATLITGTWVARHGVQWDTGDQRSDAKLAPSIFAIAKQNAAAGYKTASVTANPLYPALLGNEPGTVDAAFDCAGSDACVTERTSKLIDAGQDLIVAQYGAPAIAATASGLKSDAYQRAIADTSAAVGQLLARITQRKANDAKEDWLVIVTTGHGLDAFGASTGLQTLENKTIFIASNKPLAGLPGTGAAAPADTTLLQLASAADIAPTVLRHLGITPAATAYGWNGMALQGAASIREFAAKTGADKDNIELSWKLAGKADVPVQVLRDGKLVASLPAGSTTYADYVDATSDGSYRYVYTLAAGDTALALSAQIAFLKPVPLAPTLLNGLVNYYPLDTLPGVDAKAGASTLAPWAADADGGSLVADDGIRIRYRAKALRVDSRIANAGGTAGYRLMPTNDVTTDAATTAFTIGFWVRMDSICSQGVGNGSPIIGNKNYDSGASEGIAIGLFGSCELRFNTGAGGSTPRGEIKGIHYLSAGQWAYVAWVIDKAGQKMDAYAIDPVKGVQTGSLALTPALIAKLGGMKAGIGLNEDGTGLYYKRQASSPRGAMDFNEFAIWNRALTADEVASLYKAGAPLSTLTP
ncbi:LamG domain-containing protein [Variovorax sp. KBW07]|uniref:LamG domain-containing protein n=1 Tax=Variovorax sp. KBW07 TaxID=2153358 RepID=UPI0021AA0BFF|nr:LamG domain-containing protein [Variovorax sp. KBW07]